MGFVSGLVIFIILWWVILFLVLPWKVEKNKKLLPNQDRGAPKRSYIGYKLAITSISTVLVWLIIYFVMKDI